jgi:hypothetical protein
MNIDRRNFLKQGSLGVFGITAIPMLGNQLFAKPAGDLFLKSHWQNGH